MPSAADDSVIPYVSVLSALAFCARLSLVAVVWVIAVALQAARPWQWLAANTTSYNCATPMVGTGVTSQW